MNARNTGINLILTNTRTHAQWVSIIWVDVPFCVYIVWCFGVIQWNFIMRINFRTEPFVYIYTIYSWMSPFFIFIGFGHEQGAKKNFFRNQLSPIWLRQQQQRVICHISLEIGNKVLGYRPIDLWQLNKNAPISITGKNVHQKGIPYWIFFLKKGKDTFESIFYISTREEKKTTNRKYVCIYYWINKFHEFFFPSVQKKSSIFVEAYCFFNIFPHNKTIQTKHFERKWKGIQRWNS